MDRAPLKIFVSFTKRGGDDVFIRRLFDQLHRQPVSVWVFEDAGTDIPGGDQISAHLTAQIDACDVFIPVVSANTLKSPYTGLEVEYALKQRAGGSRRVIIPLVSHALANTSQWTAPYHQLAELKYRTVDFEDRLGPNTFVLSLCTDLKLQYLPPLPEDPRLPHMNRFEKELRGRLPRRTDREIGIYVRLMEVLNRFADQFERGQLEAARWSMNYFCSMCEFEFPDQKFYYPYIVLAVCQILNQDLASAEATFQGLINHEKLDESVLTGLGHISYSRRDYQTALEYYQHALKQCPSDPAATVGMLMNSILCGKTVELDGSFHLLDTVKVTHTEDYQSIQSIKAIALANSGHIRQALSLISELILNRTVDAATIVHLARELFNQGAGKEAIQLLRSVESQLDSALVLHALATFEMRSDRLSEAGQVYTKLVKLDPDNRQYRFEFGQVLLRQGRAADCRAIVRPMLEVAKRSPPQSATDFFLDGFANWICGHAERAEYDFERSGFPAEHHYRYLSH